MARARARKQPQDEWLSLTGLVSGYDASVSFGAGYDTKHFYEPWTERFTIEIRARALDYDYQGARVLSLVVYGDRKFEDPAYIKRFDDEPLKNIGQLNVSPQILRGWVFISRQATERAMTLLATNRPLWLALTFSKPRHRSATIRSIGLDTEREVDVVETAT